MHYQTRRGNSSSKKYAECWSNSAKRVASWRTWIFKLLSLVFLQSKRGSKFCSHFIALFQCLQGETPGFSFHQIHFFPSFQAFSPPSSLTLSLKKCPEAKPHPFLLCPAALLQHIAPISGLNPHLQFLPVCVFSPNNLYLWIYLTWTTARTTFFCTFSFFHTAVFAGNKGNFNLCITFHILGMSKSASHPINYFFLKCNHSYPWKYDNGSAHSEILEAANEMNEAVGSGNQAAGWPRIWEDYFPFLLLSRDLFISDLKVSSKSQPRQ